MKQSCTRVFNELDSFVGRSPRDSGDAVSQQGFLRQIYFRKYIIFAIGARTIFG